MSEIQITSFDEKKPIVAMTNGDDREVDTHNMADKDHLGNWQFTAPQSGFYNVSVRYEDGIRLQHVGQFDQGDLLTVDPDNSENTTQVYSRYEGSWYCLDHVEYTEDYQCKNIYNNNTIVFSTYKQISKERKVLRTLNWWQSLKQLWINYWS